MSSEWEVVLKGGKRKNKSQLSNKERKQFEGKNLENNKFNIPANVDEDTDISQSPNDVVVKSKNKKKKNNREPVDIKKSLSELSVQELKRIYNELTEKITNPVLALIDLSLHIDLQLPNEVNYRGHFEDSDFPIAHISKPTLTFLLSLFEPLTKESTCSFLKTAINNLESDLDKDTESIGLKILLQVCLKCKSSVLITERKNFLEIFNLYREHPTKFKLLVWIIKQGCVNFHTACQLWLAYLLPFITQRCHIETIFQFAEQIQDLPNSVSKNEIDISVTDFVPLLDLVFMNVKETKKTNKKKGSSLNLSDIHINKLRLLYQKIKDIAFQPKILSNLKEYFGSLFIRLSSETHNHILNAELLDCIDKCLISVPNSLNQLMHLHISYPNQTEILLNYLNSDKCKNHPIRKTSVFKKTKDLINKSTQDAPIGSSKRRIYDLTQIDKNDKSSCSILKSLLYLFLILSFSCTLFHAYYPNEFNKSIEILKPYWNEGINKISPIINWISTHTCCIKPYFYKARDNIIPLINWAYGYIGAGYIALKPYLNVAYDKLQIFIVYLKPYLAEILEHVDGIYQYLLHKFEEYFPIVLNVIEDVRKKLVISFNKVFDFIQSKEFQNVLKSIYEFLESVWNSISKLMNTGYIQCQTWLNSVIGN